MVRTFVATTSWGLVAKSVASKARMDELVNPLEATKWQYFKLYTIIAGYAFKTFFF